jgi:DNA-binding response OmpR family regulator
MSSHRSDGDCTEPVWAAPEACTELVEDAPSWALAETSSSSRRCVVVAEDDHEMRALVVAALRRDGHDVIAVPDGNALLVELASRFLREPGEPAGLLVVSDIRMPGRDGLSVLRAFRAQGWCPTFILLTAFGDGATHAEARRLGATALFDKPFDLYDLRTAVLNAPWRRGRAQA